MKQTIRSRKREACEREALRKRVKYFYRRLNRSDWEDCFALIDPQLTRTGKVKVDVYSRLMESFKTAYGSVNPRWTRLSLHLQVAKNQRDSRPFAYVYVIWQDAAHGYHLFRERWIKENGQWYTRVVALVPNRSEK